MKSFTRIKIVLILTPLLLWGCEKVIDSFDFLESEPKLVVNAPLVSDSTIIIHVSHTIGIMDDDAFNFIDNAVARLYAGDNLIGEATYVDSGYYAFGVLPSAGLRVYFKS